MTIAMRREEQPGQVRSGARTSECVFLSASSIGFLLPKRSVRQRRDIVSDVMAPARHAGHLIVVCFLYKVRGLLVTGCFEIRARARVAMEALAVIERLIKLDLTRLRDCPQVLNVDMGQSPPFVFQTTEHRVVGMAGVTGSVAWHAIV